MTVRFTKHAKDMLRERGFERDMIVSIVENPEWREAEGDIWFAFRKVGRRVVRVVVRGRRKPYTVITMYCDRRLRE